MMSSRRMQQNRDFTPLKWDEFFDEKRTISFDGNLFNVYLKLEVSSRINCRILAPDLRGHGDTVTNNDNDLSTERQVQSVLLYLFAIYYDVYKSLRESTKNMGGALAVHAVNSCLIPNIVGLVVIDVVEGSAMESLSGMVKSDSHNMFKMRVGM
uniref:Protein phosphatase methylesterase-1 n=1 Tax=Heterorhabditis bacteriophora TaxID=37862 RepID=A0A1I7X3S6_HETBA